MAVDTESMPVLRTETVGKDALVSRLDEMLEDYLNTLDAYQQAHQQLTQHLSSVRHPTYEYDAVQSV
jgi:molybdenum-dependent DNA-binding transcriptional regulator ModE